MPPLKISYVPVLHMAFQHPYYNGPDGPPLRLTVPKSTQPVLRHWGVEVEQTDIGTTLWRRNLPPADPAPTTESLVFFLESHDPDFLTWTDPNWPNPAQDTDHLLSLTLPKHPIPTELNLQATQFERVRIARQRLRLPNDFPTGIEATALRDWSETQEFRTLIPTNRTLSLPPCPTASYTLQAGAKRLRFCPVPNRAAARIGVIEMPIPKVGSTPAMATLQFETIQATLDYVIIKTDPAIPLETASITVADDGPVAFHRLPRTPDDSPATTRFRSNAPYVMAKQPPVDHRFELVIPPFALKHPPPRALAPPSAGDVRRSGTTGVVTVTLQI